MMRPGLDKPGALPLLALIIFSLLTLVPSLSSIYNLKFADLADYTRASRRGPLIQDSPVKVPTDSHLAGTRKPFLQDTPSTLRSNALYQYSRIEDGASAITTEAARVDNRNRAPRAATDSSFAFSRRARALRAFLTQQLDEYRLLAPFANRSLPADSDLSSPFRPASQSFQPPVDDGNDGSARLKTPSELPPKLETDSSHRSPHCRIWQQACHSALKLWSIAKKSPFTSAIQQTPQTGSQSIMTALSPRDDPGGPSNLPVGNSKDPPATGIAHSAPPVFAGKSHALIDEKPTAAGRHSPQLQGSCMAVVIGLVAGIIWF
ncbi:hypothetical protein N7492_010413 [Penicillium capsulatum]|uniref:Uncharacterized protein n=1 Tax=Penicillium capsulatum TaxID=69766 RepID=A0A9W9HL84_9EURO|nr:hypothetical protein N7492_010413 [Penicillium capsulatum]KAJ6112917.1 hypothetical protein N7512_008241 [Penicillium capsulatum]